MKSAAVTYPAATAGFSFATDPELRLPERPRFIPEIAVIPYGAMGILFDGAKGSQVLNGRAARHFVPQLIRRLDGETAFADLLNAFPGVPSKTVYDAVALLYSRGLLEDGASPLPEPALRNVGSFLGRFVDVTRVNSNRGAAADRLRRASVGLVGRSDRKAQLEIALTGCGIGKVGLLAEPTSLDPEDAPDLLVGVFAEPEDGADTWSARAAELGVPLLHVGLQGTSVEIGPLILPGKSASYECFRALRPTADAIKTAPAGFWIGVVALHTFHLLSRIGNPSLYNVVHVHKDGPGGRLYEEIRLARLPGHAAAGLATKGPHAHGPGGVLWLLHNAANGMPPRALLSPRDYQMHYAAANIQATKDVPEPYYGAEQVALPEGSTLDILPAKGPSVTPVTLTLAAVAGLLRHAVGYQSLPDGRRRIAPSAGGMGSAEAFLIVRDLPGLESGVYHYYAHAHRLDRLGVVLDRELAGALGIVVAALPPVIWVGTASLVKIRQKYNNFAFRFANLDAGVARLYAHETLHALDVPFEDYSSVHDASLAALIRMPTVGTRHLVTYVLGLGRQPRLPDVQDIRSHHYVDMLAAMAANPPPLHRPVSTAEWPSIDLSTHLGELFRQRRSHRSFSRRPVGRSAIEAIARVAAGTAPMLAASGALPVSLRFWIGVTVDGPACPGGLYAFEPSLGGLRPIRAGLTAAELDRAMLQRALARAPVSLFITGDFGDAVRRFEARGYRELIGQAGASAARALLAAEALGLSGCPWGGLTEDGWGELFDIDRYSDCPLFGVSLGYAADAS